MSGDKQDMFDSSGSGRASGSGIPPARFEQVLDTTDTVVWEVDFDGLAIDYVGPAERVAGIQPDTAATPMELNARMVHPEDQLGVANQFEEVLAGERESLDIEFRTNPENGRVRWIRMQGSVEQRGGKGSVLTGLATDITPLKEREARLEEFAGVVSHDLRNPLSVATTRVELAQDESDSEHLAHARDALDRMEVLIENLLALARTDRTVGELEPVALDSLVRAAWQAVDTADATLTVDVDRTIRADSTRLRQLLENLVRNAVEHGSRGGRDETGGLEMHVGPLDDGFFVEDDGIGMPEEQREALFTGKTGGEHTGLGLRIVEEVAEAHDWTINATESDAGGARFEITGVEFV